MLKEIEIDSPLLSETLKLGVEDRRIACGCSCDYAGCGSEDSYPRINE